MNEEQKEIIYPIIVVSVFLVILFWITLEVY